MNIPDKGRVLEAPPTGTGETSKNVTLGKDTSKNITSSPRSYTRSYKYLTDSLKHGSKTEQLLACFMTYDHVSKTIAKQVYGETRLQQRVADLTACAFRSVRPPISVLSGHLFRYHPASLILPSSSLLFT